jgi:leucine dehydrogenase
VFRTIVAACERKFGSKDLTGKRVTLQGVGHVGIYLLDHLKKAGAVVTVCDTNKDAVARAKSEYGAAAVETDKIYDVPCDVYSPNAVGQTVNHDTLKRLSCQIIAGGANNQLIDASVYETITKRGMLYCPDFVVNAGGVINVGAELIPGGYKEAWVVKKVDNIYHTIHQVLDEAESRKKFPEVVAVELAKERIAKASAGKK